jgi:hypothetical protein
MRQAKKRAKLTLGWGTEECEMCDYSLHNVKTRPAKVDDKLTVRDFGTGTRGFSASEDRNVAVCLLPGTELSFAEEVGRASLWPWSKSVIKHRTAFGKSTKTSRHIITTRLNSRMARSSF